VDEAWEFETEEESISDSRSNTGYLSALIDKAINDNPDSEIRKYIGASSIGNPCERKLWYSYQGIPGLQTEPKMQRTFDIGSVLEGLVLDYIEDAGFNILRTQGDQQLDILTDTLVPELQGHCDAIVLDSANNPTALIEVKTARDSSFKIFVRSGLQKWYPVYYSQIQTYMGMSGIHEAYVIAINKDTSELHDEFVTFDASHYDSLREKALRIVEATTPPTRINNNPCYFVCRNCQYRNACHSE